MKKRLFAIMLALAMLLAAVPALAEEGEGGKALETAAKITCKVCEKVVDKVDANGLCKDCAIKQVATRSIEASATATNEGGVAGGEGNGTGDNTGGTTDGETGGNLGNNAGNTDNNGGNTGGTTGDNTGESNNTDSTGNSDSTGGDTGTNGGQKPPTSDEEGGGGQPDNPQQQCTHNNVEYVQYATEAEGRYSNHKKVCMDCRIELVEPHQWDENTKKPKTEGTNIPTCTNGGDWTKKCRLCSHVTVFKGSALGHDYDDPTWNWCGVSSATATFKCKRNCKEKNAIVTRQVRPTRSGINNCGYYTYTATVEFNDKTYTNTRTDYSCRPDWYYDPCYYNNPCGHWGCGNVCTRYSNCVPCQNYRTTFRVGGYNCLATPKTGDVSVIGMALISLAGAGAAIMGKKRK